MQRKAQLPKLPRRSCWQPAFLPAETTEATEATEAAASAAREQQEQQEQAVPMTLPLEIVTSPVLTAAPTRIW